LGWLNADPTHGETIMPVKITETIERWCCEPKDLKKYRGEGSKSIEMFCQHCGQQFTSEKYTDAAGARDTKLVKCGLGI